MIIWFSTSGILKHEFKTGVSTTKQPFKDQLIKNDKNLHLTIYKKLLKLLYSLN